MHVYEFLVMKGVSTPLGLLSFGKTESAVVGKSDHIFHLFFFLPKHPLFTIKTQGKGQTMNACAAFFLPVKLSVYCLGMGTACEFLRVDFPFDIPFSHVRFTLLVS